MLHTEFERVMAHINTRMHTPPGGTVIMQSAYALMLEGWLQHMCGCVHPLGALHDPAFVGLMFARRQCNNNRVTQGPPRTHALCNV